MRAWSDFGIGRLFEESRDPVVLIEDLGTIVLWNRAATKLFGYTADEAVGMNIDRLVPPEFKRDHHAGIARYHRTGHGPLIDSERPIEVPGLHKDGSRVWLELALTPVESKGKRYALGVIRDISDRVKLRERQQADQKQLEEVNRTLESFAHVVSHDLKEPVRGMGVYLEALDEEPEPVERRRLLQRAIAAQRDLQRFIEGLLEWSRTATLPSDPEALRLHEVLRDRACAAQWQALQDERGARVEVAEDIPEVLATRALVCRVFGNLVTNAIRHNPSPQPVVQIHRGDAATPGFVDVWVDDNGPGFPPTVLHMMSHDPRSLRTGFGLVITRRAVERLQGEMAIENRPEGGGRVRVRLPAPLKPIVVKRGLDERVRELI